MLLNIKPRYKNMGIPVHRILPLIFLGACLFQGALSSENLVDEAAGLGAIELVDPLEGVGGQLHAETPVQSDLSPDGEEKTDTVESDSTVIGSTGDATEETASVEEVDRLSNLSSDVTANSTDLPADDATKNTTNSGRPTKVKCALINVTEEVELMVQILNGTGLPNSFQTTPNLTVAPCALTLFYVPWCHFSTAAARNYNALPRLYPDINCFAVNSATYSSLNARYGTVAVPTLLLFHNGQPVAKFNDTQYNLDKFVEFVRKNTGLEPVGEVKLTSADMKGPLPGTPVEETDYLLWLAWIFLVSCGCYGVTKSVVWQTMVETLRNNWQEAEAQHEHAE